MGYVACVYTCWMFLPWDQESSTEVCDIIFWALGTPVAQGFCPTQSSNHSVPNHTYHTNIHIHQTFKNRINILRILLFKVFNLWIYVVSTFTQNLIFVPFLFLICMTLQHVLKSSDQLWLVMLETAQEYLTMALQMGSWSRQCEPDINLPLLRTFPTAGGLLIA